MTREPSSGPGRTLVGVALGVAVIWVVISALLAGLDRLHAGRAVYDGLILLLGVVLVVVIWLRRRTDGGRPHPPSR